MSLRDWLKNAEFYLPPAVSRPAIRATRLVSDPYTEEMDQLRCIFIHVPKTAGTSIANAIFKSKSRHIPAARYRAIDPERFARYFKFCVVRNPFDRLYSAYEYLRPHVGRSEYPDFIWASENLAAFDSFEAFVLGLRDRSVRARIMRYIHFRPQHHWVRLPFVSACAMDKIGRYETLAADYAEITERLGVAAPELQRLRVGSHRDYRDVFTPAMQAIAGDLYATDIKLFGYGFG